MNVKIPIIGKVPKKIGFSSVKYSFSNTTNYSLTDYDSSSSQEYIENVPHSNFVIKPWRHRILDNRGFDLRITDSNMSFLLSNANIIHGRIIEPCQYVRRSGKKYWLVPTRFIEHD